MALRVIALSSLVFLLSLISFAAMATSAKCAYVVRVKTGDVQDASTDSTISLKLNTSSGNGFSVDNLEDWGIMEPGHNYFEQDKLDVFSGTGPCLDLCAITVISDGRGTYPGVIVQDEAQQVIASAERSISVEGVAMAARGRGHGR
ncbi:PLAT domain-containing protein 1-like [Neltuma alba]|uniref:PLAT domain-containing protein 1-like n=1 Tax=Neltuma alba TaxID=207710 RepID=UPI0010A2C4AC|nr:PLAT domain-containing protein 1-like [Prosopis alba]